MNTIKVSNLTVLVPDANTDIQCQMERLCRLLMTASPEGMLITRSHYDMEYSCKQVLTLEGFPTLTLYSTVRDYAGTGHNEKGLVLSSIWCKYGVKSSIWCKYGVKQWYFYQLPTETSKMVKMDIRKIDMDQIKPFTAEEFEGELFEFYEDYLV